MRRVVVLTGSELRHAFVRKALALAPDLEVVRTYCEGLEKSLARRIDPGAPGADRQLAHVEARAASEEDFFRPFVELTPDRSNPVFIPKGTINDAAHVDAIRALAPDVLVAYGCSIVKAPLLEAFDGRFLNAHLGLSPYYRGAGTNFWALVNGEPELVGTTFMHIDAGVDTGKIIHQLRARVFPGDTPHQIGNRLIADTVASYVRVIHRFDALPDPPAIPEPANPRYYRQKDFTPEATDRLYAAFADGLVDRYLREREARVRATPIAENPGLAG